MKAICSMALLITVYAGSLSAQLQTLALDFTGEDTNGFQAELTLGWSFEVTHPIRLNALGFFDHFEADEDGLMFDHLVRVWTDTTTPELLTSSLITNDSTFVNSMASNGRWLFNEIAPVALLPGNYVIGADDPACGGLACDRFRLIVNETTIPEIAFGEARSASPTGPPQSSQPQLNGGYFGPSMMATRVILGDINGDSTVDLLDVAPFTDAVSNGTYIIEADINLDGEVNLLDVAGFIQLLSGN